MQTLTAPRPQANHPRSRVLPGYSDGSPSPCCPDSRVVELLTLPPRLVCEECGHPYPAA